METIQIRWLIRRDMDDVLDIDRSSFATPWLEEEFFWQLKQRNAIGSVIEQDGRNVGYMIYTLHVASLKLVRFAVHPDRRGQGLGTAMVERLIDKLSLDRRRRIFCDVPETNLPAQLFLKERKFRAESIHSTDNYDHNYRFVYNLKTPDNETGLNSQNGHCSGSGTGD